MAERVETTFWSDFTIAEAFGKSAVQDTFNRAFDEWKHNYKYLTELVMALNHKCWWCYDISIKAAGKSVGAKYKQLSKLYAELYEKANDFAYDNLQGEELQFYWEVTD